MNEHLRHLDILFLGRMRGSKDVTATGRVSSTVLAGLRSRLPCGARLCVSCCIHLVSPPPDEGLATPAPRAALGEPCLLGCPQSA